MNRTGVVLYTLGTSSQVFHEQHGHRRADLNVVKCSVMNDEMMWWCDVLM